MSQIPVRPTRILAIDPTTKGFGYAILDLPLRGAPRPVPPRCGSARRHDRSGLTPLPARERPLGNAREDRPRTWYPGGDRFPARGHQAFLEGRGGHPALDRE